MARHDIVETNKMAMEYVGSLIDVEREAKTDLDNGRLVVREGATYTYPTDNKAAELFLVTTPEVLYETGGLHEFFNKKGKKVRAVRVEQGDVFSTTAKVGDLNKDDLVEVNKTGQLVAKTTDAAIEFKVLEKRVLGSDIGITVERIK